MTHYKCYFRNAFASAGKEATYDLNQDEPRKEARSH